MKRLCIYCFYDKDGIVDDYVLVCLRAIREFFSEICVVVNGNLTKESGEKLKSVCNNLLLRDNKGFDAWAYKEALCSYGFDYVAENLDEVLLSNFSCFAPIGSFKPMFDKMDKTCDFWGHCRSYPSAGQMCGGQPIPEHLQSYFLLFRKHILQSDCWKGFWKTLKPINSYDDAILHYELRLTRYFEERGFVSASYTDNRRKVGCNRPLFDPYDMVVVDHSPFIKRKSFFAKSKTWEFYAPYSRYNEVLRYISDHNLYDLRLIFSNLLRTGDFVFPKLMTWYRIKYLVLGKILKLKRYKIKMKALPDYRFIKQCIK